MKFYFNILLFSSLMALPAYATLPQEGSGETDGYVLVWQDLFDDGQLNPSRWNIEVNGSGGGNNELQYYTDREENVRVGDDGDGNGCLILTARREDYKNRNFTSGRVNSLGKIAFTHGKIEASVKLPKTANGLWPAFWMMGNDYSQVGWPRCGETDILEMGNAEGIQKNIQEAFFNGACHWGPQWPNASYAQSTTKNYSLQDGEYHLFTCIWDENSIKMYVDLDKTPKQNPYYRIDIPQDDPDNEWSAGNYFHKDNFILFNLAVGGNFTGIHDAEKITALNEDNNQEASYYINFVKVYQKGLDSDHQNFADAGDPIVSNPGNEDPDMAEEENPKDEDNNNGEIEEPGSSVDALVSENKEIIFDGKTIKGMPPVGLYTLDGRKLDESQNGIISLDNVSSGIYIARSANTSRKIFVK